MRKLKLQVQISIDGFIAGPAHEMDWLVWNWDQEMMDYVTAITEPVSTIILGRKLAEGFIPAWQKFDEQGGVPGAEKMNSTPKVVFSKTVNAHEWPRTVVNNGDLAEEVNKLKAEEGGDIIAYGGAQFVAALVAENLIDEYNLLVNPTAIGQGLSIFTQLAEKRNLKLVEAKAFACGIAGLRYEKVVEGQEG